MSLLVGNKDEMQLRGLTWTDGARKRADGLKPIFVSAPILR